jgi:hypothetical protein
MIASTVEIRCLDVHGFDFPVQCAEIDAQIFCCFFPVALVSLECLADQNLFHLAEARFLPTFLSVGGAQFARQVFWFDDISTAEYEGLFYNVFQLAYITGIIVLHQAGHYFVRNARDILALQRIELCNQMLDEQGDILASLLEGWQLEMDYTDAIV